MGANILIISENRQVRNSILTSIAAGCEEINLDLEGIYLNKNTKEAIEKMSQVDIHVILCDIQTKDWQRLRKLFGKGRITKAFITFGEAGSCTSPEAEQSDGFFCSKSLIAKDGAAKACKIIAELIARKNRREDSK